MKITDFIQNNTLFLDGGMGTLLQDRGLCPGELPERWNISHPDVIVDIHKAYLDAGSNVISTNTFGANRLKLDYAELEEIIKAAVENAREAIKKSRGDQEKWVALDIGPTGRMLKPFGDLDFEEAVSVFADTVKLGVKYGVDLVFIETMADSYETKAALLAAKEGCSLPIFVSNAYGEDGKLLTGATPAAMVALLEGMGADAIGVNCSFGPKELAPVIDEYLRYSSLPLILKPNAGLPKIVGEAVEYDCRPDDFSDEVSRYVGRGVGIVGGCCGTTPEHIASLVNKAEKTLSKPREEKNVTLVSSYSRAIEIGKRPVVIGERINPTGKPAFKEALRHSDTDYVVKEAISQEEAGADILDVNVGLPGIDEAECLCKSISVIQAVCPLPLQIDTSDAVAMERALRIYNGKAMINSVNGKEESLSTVFPLVKKYGGVVVALTLDEKGIPKRAEDRVEIAKKIISRASSYGISPKDIIFDPLAMAVSADREAALETLRAVKMINELGCHTALGVSNVSFGLPRRDIINASFFTSAMSLGLSAAIINPRSAEMMTAYRAYLALSGYDGDFSGYISLFEQERSDSDNEEVDLKRAIIKGMKDRAAALTSELLSSREPLDIINSEIIPALDVVGEGYEKKRLYLPSLLMSAEAASSAFEVIRSASARADTGKGLKVVLATVKGDVHDIGKNIVKLVLENYGFCVFDLGKDVSPETVLSEALRLNADVVGLSALMTTTLPSMKRSIELLKNALPDCRIIVGGAVLTEEYAESIGADFYAKDAMAAVRYLELIK